MCLYAYVCICMHIGMHIHVFVCVEDITSILVMWLECRFLVTEVDCSNPDIGMLCP